ncbi:hypothetical protein OG216_11835 [Streptomycetaceae bacterium NBC_01309]
MTRHVGRTLTAVIVVAVAVTAAILGLRESFQYKVDRLDADRESVIHVDVATRPHDVRSIDVQALWGLCAAPLTSTQLTDIQPPQTGNTFEIVVHPALDRHQRSRVEGCLRDMTVERLRTSNVSVTDRPAAVEAR